MAQRITAGMMSSSYLSGLNRNMNRMMKLENQMLTNSKYEKFSDNPVAAVYGLQARARLARNAKYTDNVADASAWLTEAENNVKDFNGLMVEVYENVVQWTNDTNAKIDRATVASKVKELRDHLVQLGNGAFNGKYVFGGYNTVSQPFKVDEATGILCYKGVPMYMGDDLLGQLNGLVDQRAQQVLADPSADTTEVDASIAAVRNDLAQIRGIIGATMSPGDPLLDSFDNLLGRLTDISLIDDTTAAGIKNAIANVESAFASHNSELSDEHIQFEVGFSIYMDVNLTGVEVMGLNDKNMYKMLDDLYNKLTATEDVFVDPDQIWLGTESKYACTSEDIKVFIRPLQQEQQRMLAYLGELGGRSNRLDLLETRYALDEVNYTEVMSHYEDADVEKVYMEFTNAMNTWNAALSFGSRVIPMSLANFLK